MASSIWVFTLLAMEAVKTYRTNPYFMLGDTKIPTWITPLVLVLFVTFLVPNTSLLGHLCGLLFGYGCKLPLWLKISETNVEIRGTRLSQVPCTARKSIAMDRRENESAWQASTLRISRPEDIWPIRRPSHCESDTCRSYGQWDCPRLRWKLAEVRTMSDARYDGVTILVYKPEEHNMAFRASLPSWR